MRPWRKTCMRVHFGARDAGVGRRGRKADFGIVDARKGCRARRGEDAKIEGRRRLWRNVGGMAGAWICVGR